MGACSSKPKTREMEDSLEPSKKARDVEVDVNKATADAPQEHTVTEKGDKAKTGKEGEVVQETAGDLVSELKAVEDCGKGDAIQGEMDQEANLHEESGGGGEGVATVGKAEYPIGAAPEDQEAIGVSDVLRKDLDSSSMHAEESVVVNDDQSVNPTDGFPGDAGKATETDDSPSVEPTDGCAVPKAGAMDEAAFVAPDMTSAGDVKAEVPGVPTEMETPARPEVNSCAVEAEGPVAEGPQVKLDAPGEESTAGTMDPVPGPSVEEAGKPAVEPLEEKSDEGGTGECKAEPPGAPDSQESKVEVEEFDTQSQEPESEALANEAQSQESKTEAETEALANEAQSQESKTEDMGRLQESKTEVEAEIPNPEAAEQVNDDLIDREASFKDASDAPLEPELSPPQ